MFHMIPLSVFPFPSAPCRKRVVSYLIIAFCCRSFNLSIAASPLRRFRARTGLRLPASASLSLASRWPRPQQLLPVPATGGGRRRCSQRESHWQAGQVLLDEQSFILSGTVVPCGLDSWQLYKARFFRSLCPRKRGPAFCASIRFQRPVQSVPARQCLSLWERCHRR